MSLLGKLGLVRDPIQTVPTIVSPIQTPTPAKFVRGRRASADEEEEDTTTDFTAPTNKQVEARLRKAVIESGTEGFDFVNFFEMVKKNKNADEATAYSAALLAAETMGVSVEELATSAQNSIKAVTNESKKIDADLAEKAEQNALDQTELKKINTQISNLETRKETLESKINSDSSGIDESQRSLEATVELVVSEIKDVVSKMKKNSK